MLFGKFLFFLICSVVFSSCAIKSTTSEHKNEVQKTIFENISGIQKCYSDLIKIYPGMQGRVVTRFNINPNGDVAQANIESSTVNNIQLEDCVIKHLKSIKFIKNNEGTDVEVKYPFVFQPTSP